MLDMARAMSGLHEGVAQLRAEVAQAFAAQALTARALAAGAGAQALTAGNQAVAEKVAVEGGHGGGDVPSGRGTAAAAAMTPPFEQHQAGVGAEPQQRLLDGPEGQRGGSAQRQKGGGMTVSVLGAALAVAGAAAGGAGFALLAVWWAAAAGGGAGGGGGGWRV